MVSRSGRGRSRVELASIMAFCALALAATPAAAQEAPVVGDSGPAARPGAAAPGGGVTLEEVLRAAMASHPGLGAAAARVDAARGALRGAREVPNPEVTYQVENSRFPGRDLPRGLDPEVSAFVELPLEELYQRGPRVRRANAAVAAAESDYRRAGHEIALEAARAFYRVALAQVSVEAAEEVLAGYDALSEYNRARVAEGVTAGSDLIRVQVERERAATELALERVELARARSELGLFLGWSGPDIDSLRVTFDDAAVTIDLPPLADLLAEAAARRPDLIAARSRVAAAEAEASYQRRLALPRMTATFGTKSVDGVSSMIAGVSVPVPLFNRNRGEVERAEGERAAAERELEWAERRVRGEVESAYEAAKVLAGQVATLRESFLRRAEESRRITMAAYEEGAASLLEVLDATRALAEARRAYYRAIFAQQQSLLELNVAVGLPPVAGIPSPRAASEAPGAAPSIDGGRP